MVKNELHAEDGETRLRPDDESLRSAVVMALEWALPVPHGVTVAAEEGRITITGAVTWMHQRNAAARAVSRVNGVVHVVNRLVIQPARPDEDVRAAVLAALQRRLGPDAAAIRVEAMGRVVTLSGHAHSWRAVDIASDAARSVEGVGEVIDCIHMRTELEEDRA